MAPSTRWLMELPPLGRAEADEAQRGASLVEYALLVALIALVCVAGVIVLGESASDSLSESGSSVASATG